jgi:hypothetical protein
MTTKQTINNDFQVEDREHLAVTRGVTNLN